MKKVLLASAALVLTAGVASAQVSVSGTAGIWLQDTGETGSNAMVNYDLNLSFSASGETDGGLTMGLDYTTLEDGTVDNTEVFVSGSFGKLTVGDTDNALQMVAGMGDIGYDGIGVDNAAEISRGAGNASGVLYSFSSGDFAFYLGHSMDTGDDDISAGVSASFGDFAFGLGYIDAASIGDSVMAADLSGSFGNTTFGLYYEDSDLTGSGYGIEVGFTTGAATVSLGYGHSDQAFDAAMGIGFAYDLGGASVSGGVGQVNNAANTDTVTAWDLGISMDF